MHGLTNRVWACMLLVACGVVGMLRYIIYAHVGHADLIVKVVVAVLVPGSAAHTMDLSTQE